MTRRFAMIVLVLLLADTAMSQGGPAQKAAPTSEQTKANREKERAKAIPALKMRVQRFMEARKLLVGICGRCEGEGRIVVGHSGGLTKAGQPCPASCFAGRVWSSNYVDKVTRDFYSSKGVSSEAAKTFREEFAPATFAENYKRLDVDSWGYAPRKDHVVFFGDSHAHVYLKEDGELMPEPSAWVLAEDPMGKEMWCLWTEKDAAWPSMEAEGSEDTATAEVVPEVPVGEREERAPAEEERGAPDASPAASRGVPVLARPVSAAERAFEPGESAGLFVGVRTFKDAGNPESSSVVEVPCAVDDAIDLAHAFSIEYGLMPATRVHLCLSGLPRKNESAKRLEELREAGATVQSAEYLMLWTQIRSVPQLADENGILVMSFATHGFHTEAGDDYLMASDSPFGHPEVALSGRTISEQASLSKAQRRILLFDACRQRLLSTRDDESKATGLSASFAEEVGRHAGTFALFAASVGGYSYDDVNSGNGVFTRAFIDGLRGQATADERNMITLKAIADYVNLRVRAWRASHEASMSPVHDIERRSNAEFEGMPLAFRHVQPPEADADPDSGD